jgi:hypothetical protein
MHRHHLSVYRDQTNPTLRDQLIRGLDERECLPGILNESRYFGATDRPISTCLFKPEVIWRMGWLSYLGRLSHDPGILSDSRPWLPKACDECST